MHKTSESWANERRKYLTATDVVDLWPYTPTGKEKKSLDNVRLSIIAKKRKFITEDNIISTGAAGRGHVLEEYALKNFKEYHHWDDAIIYKKSDDILQLGFSPDGLTIPQDNKDVSVETSWLPINTTAIEVKSFNANKHIETAIDVCNKDYNKIDAVKQMAVALSFDQISNSVLLLYNPDMIKEDERLYRFEFSKEDLKEQIATVHKVHKDFNTFITKFTDDIKEMLKEYSYNTKHTIHDIMKDLESIPNMNPV